MDASHVEGTADQRMLSDRRVEKNNSFEEEHRSFDRRLVKTPETVSTAWPFPGAVDK